jgi:uncharacterized protein (DUF4415 family)
MSSNSRSTDLASMADDDIPDMSDPDWVKRFAKAKVSRGRPRIDTPKVSTTLRLDSDVLEAFKANGQGWQGRMNAALRKAAGL